MLQVASEFSVDRFQAPCLMLSGMAHQLLWIETLLKFSGGLILALAPIATARVLGLPTSDSGFWPRLLGVLLIGIAAAIYVEGKGGGPRGLGLGGLVVINLIAALGLMALLVLRTAARTMRGKAILWLLAGTLVLLATIEIGHV